ncbi:hypothetical protein O6H91_04G097300 [Diphasiastrum complanatum]|uniref:Uncharacterized protein n=1 Tax=Diphasiastrum complanatum TaxID=34168 RepID=A0ACC2DZM2_DIPCM|nr:hypothetical protein O6H91_04G097300 [Diphasiastrum complanatum]
MAISKVGTPGHGCAQGASGGGRILFKKFFYVTCKWSSTTMELRHFSRHFSKNCNILVDKNFATPKPQRHGDRDGGANKKIIRLQAGGRGRGRGRLQAGERGRGRGRGRSKGTRRRRASLIIREGVLVSC